jgi:hypothetical protein
MPLKEKKKFGCAKLKVLCIARREVGRDEWEVVETFQIVQVFEAVHHRGQKSEIGDQL